MDTTSPAPAAPAGHVLETIKTKTTLDDGTKRELSAVVALPQAPAITDILASDNQPLVGLLVECLALGLNSKVRNFINGGKTAAYEIVMPANILAMVEEAALNKGQQGAALIAFHACTAAIVKVAESAGYSAAACGKIKKLISNTTALSMASAAHKTRIIALLEATGEALSDTDMEVMAAPLERILTAAQAEDDDGDFE